MGDSNDTLLEAIRHYQRSLEKGCKNKDNGRILYSIEKLYKLPIKVRHLEDTGIGRTVNSLRKLGGDVGEAAKGLVAKWKEMVCGSDPESSQNQAGEPERNRQADNTSSESGIETSADENPESEDEDNSHSGLLQIEESEDGEEVEKNELKEEADLERRHHSRKEESRSKHRRDRDSSSESEERQKYEGNESGHETKKNRDSSSEEEDSRKKHKKEAHSSRSKHIGSDEDTKKHSRDRKSQDSSSREEKKSKHKRDRRSPDSDSEDESKKHKKSEKDSRNKSKSRRDRRESSEEEPRKKHKSEDRKSKSEKERLKSKSKREREDCSDDEEHRKKQHKSDRKESSKSRRSKSASSEDEVKEERVEKVKKDKREKEVEEKHKESSSKYKSSEKESKKHGEESKKDKHSSKKEKHKSSKKEKEKLEESKSKHKSSSEKTEKSHSSSSKEEKPDKKKEKHKIKESKSKTEEKDKSKVTVPNKKIKTMPNGIDSESGASFAEALGMLGMYEPCGSVKNSTKKKSSSESQQKSSSSTSTSTSRPENSEKSTKNSTSSSSKDHVPKLLKDSNLEPLDINLSSLLPSITPNYRPLGLPLENQQRKIISDDEALSRVISSKNQRTKVYSGNKCAWQKVPTLFEVCTRILQDNIDALEYTGGVPYSILKPILEKANPDQLFMLEHHNPYLIEDTDELWQLHCQKEFRNKSREELESWREMYMRCLDEREAKLRALTANIKQTQEKSTPVRTTKLAYVDNVAKPPRNIARKQAKNGTAFDVKRPLQTPQSRLSQLATAGEAGKVAVPNPGGRAVDRSSGGGGSTSHLKPKKAPLMAKTLSLLKNRFGRR